MGPIVHVLCRPRRRRRSLPASFALFISCPRFRRQRGKEEERTRCSIVLVLQRG
eukprot:COSAG06_NODE_40570_length_401_cov_2.840532_2_plen_53_part_01